MHQERKKVGTHTYPEEERAAFELHVKNSTIGNSVLYDRYYSHDDDPMADNDFFSKLADGILLCHLINVAVPGTVDLSKLNKKENLNVYQMTENVNKAITAAKSIGCQIVNVSGEDIIKGNEIIVMGLLWQIIKIELIAPISLQDYPELGILLEKDDSLKAFAKSTPEVLMLKWLQYVLKKGHCYRRITDFSKDFCDSEAYHTILTQTHPKLKSAANRMNPDVAQRAKQVITMAKEVGVKVFLTEDDICSGNRKLNMCFLAQLFHSCEGGLVVDEKSRSLYIAAMQFVGKSKGIDENFGLDIPTLATPMGGLDLDEEETTTTTTDVDDESRNTGVSDISSSGGGSSIGNKRVSTSAKYRRSSFTQGSNASASFSKQNLLEMDPSEISIALGEGDNAETQLQKALSSLSCVAKLESACRVTIAEMEEQQATQAEEYKQLQSKQEQERQLLEMERDKTAELEGKLALLEETYKQNTQDLIKTHKKEISSIRSAAKEAEWALKKRINDLEANGVDLAAVSQGSARDVGVRSQGSGAKRSSIIENEETVRRQAAELEELKNKLDASEKSLEASRAECAVLQSELLQSVAVAADVQSSMDAQKELQRKHLQTIEEMKAQLSAAAAANVGTDSSDKDEVAMWTIKCAYLEEQLVQQSFALSVTRKRILELELKGQQAAAVEESLRVALKQTESWLRQAERISDSDRTNNGGGGGGNS